MIQIRSDPFGRRVLGERADAEKPIFVLGTGERCGSTLVQRLLNTHPDVFLFGEQHGALAHLQRFHEESMEHERSSRKTQQAYFDHLDRAFIANLSPGATAIRGALRGMLLLLLGGYAPRWGCKEIRCGSVVARFLASLFPEARFVFVTRHVLGALRSLQAWGHGNAECSEYLDRWKGLAIELAEMPAEVRERSLVLRYEELVARQDVTLELADFLRLDHGGLDLQVLNLRVADHRTIEAVGDSRVRTLHTTPEVEALARDPDVVSLLERIGYPEGREVS